MYSSDSWEEVEEDNLIIEPELKKVKEKVINIQINMLFKVISCIKEVTKKIEIPHIKERKEILLKERLNEYVKELVKDENDKNIMLFKLYKHYRIPVRIYFVMGSKLLTFIEVEILGKIGKHTKKYSFSVFSIDGTGKIKDQSFYYSNTMKSHAALVYVLNNLTDKIFKNEEPRDDYTNFDALDKEREEEMPKSLIKFKKHPKYVLESMLKWNQIVYPKRPIYGYFKGNPVYSKDNIKTLKTEKQYYKMGKVICSEKPYKIIKAKENIKLYADWQTKDLVVEGFNESHFQDFFHPNFVPVNCVYIENSFAKNMAYLLGYDYRICFLGFSSGIPVNKGIFLEKKNFFIFSNFLYYHIKYLKMKEENEKAKQLFRKWRFIIKNVKKYINIRKEIDAWN